jgi:hypothetical protein
MRGDLMSDREPTEVTNLDRYGSAELPWSRLRDLLVTSHTQPGTAFFLGTSTASPFTRPLASPAPSRTARHAGASTTEKIANTAKSMQVSGESND